MRILNDLVRSSSDHWFFRQSVLIDLQTVLEPKAIKLTLHTKERLSELLRALM
ncbi:hypothetical protein XaFJ1_GM001688 [Xanthomonas albilineans]|nr:hypothetical protein XaFJ1_GM001688 [Xanthomonas albilineans]